MSREGEKERERERKRDIGECMGEREKRCVHTANHNYNDNWN